MNRRPPDLGLLFIIVLLCLFGLAMVFSAAGYEDAARSGNLFAKSSKQLLAIGLGGTAMIALTRISLDWLKKATPAIFVLNLLVLMAVPLVGAETKGATRWIELGPFKYQPVEGMKVAMALGLAWWLDRMRAQLADWRAMAPAVGMIAGVFVLTLMQPDFGSTVVMAAAVVFTAWLAGLPHRVFASLLGTGLLAALVLVRVSEYRWRRVEAVWKPLAADTCRGDSLQMCQSLFAFHRGGLEGRGLGQASAKLYYLPEAHNDFILAIVGEELGILGVLALLALLAGLIWRGWLVARRAESYFGFLVASAITLTTACQALFNVAVALGWAPTKGLVLPFVSYGASAMLANLVAMGILLSVSTTGPRTAPAAATRNADAPAGA
jgi:cell division protein FtsW